MNIPTPPPQPTVTNPNWLDIAQALLIVFLLGLAYVAFWAQIFAGSWLAIDVVSDGIYVAYIAGLGVFVYLIWRLTDFWIRRILLWASALMLFQALVGLPHSKYSLIYPLADWQVAANAIYPILSTIAWVLIIMGFRAVKTGRTHQEQADE